MLPPAERERLLNGDWEIPDDGELFQRDWFDMIDRHQLPDDDVARSATGTSPPPSPARQHPTPTTPSASGSNSTDTSGIFYITDIVRDRKAAGAIEQLVAATAATRRPRASRS